MTERLRGRSVGQKTHIDSKHIWYFGHVGISLELFVIELEEDATSASLAKFVRYNFAAEAITAQEFLEDVLDRHVILLGIYE